MKKKWSMPECQKVKLVTEEAVLQNCKTNLQTGPRGRGNCRGGGGGGMGACRGQAS